MIAIQVTVYKANKSLLLVFVTKMAQINIFNIAVLIIQDSKMKADNQFKNNNIVVVIVIITFFFIICPTQI